MIDTPPHNQHRRRNPLTGRWVLVSPHRTNRPWNGAVATEPQPTRPRHDASCYLCPGNRRATGELNPAYDSVHVFDNDFPALRAGSTAMPSNDALFTATAAGGRCRVICYSPDHDRTMSGLSAPQLRRVIDCWAEESQSLGAEFPWVQIFENKGEMMGCSNPHPHGQVWAADHLPDEAQLEEDHQRAFWQKHGTSLLFEVAVREASSDRVVSVNDHWLVIVPWWATWPFETLVLPRFKVQRLQELSAIERDTLAATLGDLTRRYDALFQCDFPYSMGWHGAPGQNDPAPHWQLHAHFYPPLLRSSTVRKFMVGYEMLAEAQRDLTAEQAAERLRNASPR